MVFPATKTARVKKTYGYDNANREDSPPPAAKTTRSNDQRKQVEARSLA